MMNPARHWHQAQARRKNAAMLLPRQLRAARVLAGLSRPQLAKRAGGSASAIEQFERGLTDPKQLTVERWRRALERAGVVFIDQDGHHGPGVRLRDRVEIGAKR
jgi:transcriptional regulator with XRE-family HTH domain